MHYLLIISRNQSIHTVGRDCSSREPPMSAKVSLSYSSIVEIAIQWHRCFALNTNVRIRKVAASSGVASFYNFFKVIITFGSAKFTHLGKEEFKFEQFHQISLNIKKRNKTEFVCSDYKTKNLKFSTSGFFDNFSTYQRLTGSSKQTKQKFTTVGVDQLMQKQLLISKWHQGDY
ncbi:hypothetical protein T10_8443 [Trichinella papuae]|uniref:Uncharacterized protein n=1 Tax=Trichinella papuae TaxID=268474 RepID=A0A0V1MHS5_9BILA|nr:hypothetical protein T10_8443 [Trichinella papuae]